MATPAATGRCSITATRRRSGSARPRKGEQPEPRGSGRPSVPVIERREAVEAALRIIDEQGLKR